MSRTSTLGMSSLMSYHFSIYPKPGAGRTYMASHVDYSSTDWLALIAPPPPNFPVISPILSWWRSAKWLTELQTSRRRLNATQREYYPSQPLSQRRIHPTNQRTKRRQPLGSILSDAVLPQFREIRSLVLVISLSSESHLDQLHSATINVSKINPGIWWKSPVGLLVVQVTFREQWKLLCQSISSTSAP